jgi:hypothetical protein
MKNFIFLIFLLSLPTAYTQSNPSPYEIKINQIQVIASHNSYHLRTAPAVLRFLRFLYSLGALPQDLDPKGIDYNNATLTEQLDKYGVRGLELDVWNDPEGGRFYHRAVKKYCWQNTASKIEELKKPGFKILHIPDIDFNPTNYTFVSAITEIKKWSDAHPNHLPVFINVETETASPGDIKSYLKGFAKAAPFDTVAANELDREIKSVFGEQLKGVITPDEVRGNYPTLEKAALAGNWPTLSSARGKVIFIVDGDGNSSDVYRSGHPSLQGRAMFVYSPAGTPEAAFVICNGAKEEYKDIQKYVQKGYIIRTRSDAGTTQAREGDYSSMKAAFSSAAQIVSTDYYRPDKRAGKKGWTDYHVQFPDGKMARLDSISAGVKLDPSLIAE